MSARSLNKAILIGNLTRDPELRYTPSGTAVCTFTVATNREWVDQSGQKQESTEFTRAVAWSKLAEICSQLLRKGRKVYIEGRLQTREWTSQEGQQRQITEVVISEMIALGAPTGGSDENMGEAGNYTNSSAPEDEVFVPEDSITETIEASDDQNSKKTFVKKGSDDSKKSNSEVKEDENVSDDEIPF